MSDSDSNNSSDSLFDESSSYASVISTVIPASRSAPDVPGLFFFPKLLPKSLSHRVLESIAECGYFSSLENEHQEENKDGKGSRSSRGPNQVMLFGRTRHRHSEDLAGRTETGLPRWADELVLELSEILKDKVDEETHQVLFPADSNRSTTSHSSPGPNSTSSNAPPSKRARVSESLDQMDRSSKLKDESPGGERDLTEKPQRCTSRQMIINLYQPGQGLSSHVDLPHRFGDGIILCSFGSGTVMEFEREGKARDQEPKGKDNEEQDSSETGHQTKKNKSKKILNHTINDEEEHSHKKRTENSHPEKKALYLSPLSVLILKKEARYEWKHGISSRSHDWVLDEITSRDGHQEGGNLDSDGGNDWKSRASLLERDGMRLSITIRWMLPGADVVGTEED